MPRLLLLVLLIPACAGPRAHLSEAELLLLGSWAITPPPVATVTYRPDRTWVSEMLIDIEGTTRRFRGRGTWKVAEGAIHNTTLEHDPIPGVPEIPLPALSVEKIVSLGASEYSYVCPSEGCTNTMRRVGPVQQR